MTSLRTFLRALWGLLVTTVILGGAGWGLTVWAGWPFLGHWPTGGDLTAFAEDPLTYPIIKAVVACAGWLLLLTLAAGAVLQTLAQVSPRRLRLRLPRPIQVLTATLFGVGVLNLADSAHAHDLTADTTASAPSAQLGAHSPITTPPLPPAPASPSVATADASRNPHGYQRRASAATYAQDGVTLPGGWIAWPLASGILATSAAALLHGRHPQAASTLLRNLRAARHPTTDPAADEPLQPVTVDDIALLENDAANPPPMCIAVADGAILTAEAIPRSGIGLTGPGAADALRGLIAAITATPQTATLVTTRAVLDQLSATRSRPSKVSIFDEVAAALHAVQIEIGSRYANSTPPDSAVEHPPMVLLVRPTANPTRLSALAELGHDLNIHIVVDGQWAMGATWRVDEQGYATDGQAPVGRLSILSPAAFAELSETVQPSRTADNATPAPSAFTTPPAPAASPPFYLRVLGRPALTIATRPAVSIRRSGALQIAVYLALHPDGASRTDLLEQIFGDMTRASAATTSLNTCLHELRRVLAIDGGSALLTIDGGYRLDHNQISVDWWQLQTLLQRGDPLGAVDLYGGPVADGYQWDWLPEHRQTARRLVADTFAQLANSADSPAQALDYALTGIDANPYAQDCYAAAIDAHLRMDNINGAQILHRNLMQRLSRSGAQPDPKITRRLQAHATGR